MGEFGNLKMWKLGNEIINFGEPFGSWERKGLRLLRTDHLILITDYYLKIKKI